MTDSFLAGASPASAPAPARFGLVLAEIRALLRLALPILMIALVNMGMSVTDTLMVSAVFGAEGLAAVAVGSDLYSILFYLGAGALAGIAPFYTAAATRADGVERARLERIGQIVVALLAIVLVPLLWTAPDWLGACGLDPALLDQGRGYTRAMAVTLVPMLGVMLYRTVLTAAERPRVFLAVTAAMLPLNAAGNWILMRGWGPVPAFGPTGAGLSTLGVALASLAVLVIVSRRPAGSTEQLKPAAIRPHDVLAVLRVGLPIGIATVAEVGVFLAATIYAATLGAADVAAHTLTLRVAGVAYAVPTALLQAAMVRMARAEALGDRAMRGAVTVGALGLSAGLGTLVLLALAAAAVPLAGSVFGATPPGQAAATLAAGLLLILAVTELAVNPGSAAAGLLRGRKDTRAPMLVTLAGYWVVGAPLGLWLSERQDMGITGLWIGLGTGTAVTTLLLLARLGQRSAADRRWAEPKPVRAVPGSKASRARSGGWSMGFRAGGPAGAPDS